MTDADADMIAELHDRIEAFSTVNCIYAAPKQSASSFSPKKRKRGLEDAALRHESAALFLSWSFHEKIAAAIRALKPGETR